MSSSFKKKEKREKEKRPKEDAAGLADVWKQACHSPPFKMVERIRKKGFCWRVREKTCGRVVSEGVMLKGMKV